MSLHQNILIDLIIHDYPEQMTIFSYTCSHSESDAQQYRIHRIVFIEQVE